MDERMEAIMRKLTAMALSMMFILGSVIPVGAEETQIRQTKRARQDCKCICKCKWKT